MGFVRITDNLQWIYVADLDKGVYVLKLTIELDYSQQVSKVSIVQAGWAYARYCNQVEVNKELTYMIILESWRGLRIAPLANLYAADPKEYPITLPQNDIWWYNLLQQPVFYGSYLSKDSKYLITAIRSQGIMIFDISEPLNPALYYQVKISGCPTIIEMVSTQDLLFYTDGLSLLVFKRVKPNMNDEFPNLFNGHQSKLFSYSTSFAQWRCYVSEEQTFIINAQCGDVDFLQMKNGDPYNISLFKRINAQQNTRT
ncbi:CNH domain protein (macronuclear) [Tetrahymena thermophila SB210]|uniref:CNH domain protein n=1 Tax=Tetrahymena thermophila (strain SB210) TaxID=312017 RepID=Q23DY5_TETTS|nr:CNH domain protein [Tetrahymena thermophila SB210]EAR94802.2 CNH domain protein [Tetrahymena thermophila SB210]|eukprot:XP_001015047.2 CNH domain protein [Tetrahymena thermophila SB210]